MMESTPGGSIESNEEEAPSNQVDNLKCYVKNWYENDSPSAINNMDTDNSERVEVCLASTSFEETPASFASISENKARGGSMDVCVARTPFSSDLDGEIKMKVKCEENSTLLTTNTVIVKHESNIVCESEDGVIVDSEEGPSFEPMVCESEDGVIFDSEEGPSFEPMSDEEMYNYYIHSSKSGAESESPSGPSCSGTSRVGVNSLSSDSEDELQSINIALPLKKRKMETNNEVLSSSSCSDEENEQKIDYSNLTPDEIKALVKEAKRFGTIKRRCRCPKRKWAELPVVGPTVSSGKCTIGKGDWSETTFSPCVACAMGVCPEAVNNHGRRNRRKVMSSFRKAPQSRTRVRCTIGQDVPVIDLSDSEEEIPLPSIDSEVTVTAVPAVARNVGECIVLSSSDDDDIVCEGVIKTVGKYVGSIPKEGSPDVVVLTASTTQTLPIPPLLPLPTPQVSQPTPQAPDEWPDFGIDLENWDDTINLLANITQGRTAAATPERPPSPEGWSCPICLESKTAVPEIMSTTCGHVFCGNCIQSAVKIHKKCPTCRKKLNMKQFHKIFL